MHLVAADIVAGEQGLDDFLRGGCPLDQFIPGLLVDDKRLIEASLDAPAQKTLAQVS
jgi:hypothetical protein